jgi:hypothetical protein
LPAKLQNSGETFMPSFTEADIRAGANGQSFSRA